MLKFRFWLGQKLFGTIGYGIFPSGYRISPQRVVKWPCEVPEVEAMAFVATNTTIPIPKVYRIHDYFGKPAIEMQFVQGMNLATEWKELSDEEKRNIVQELGGYIKQLRALEPPKGDMVASVSGGPCREVRVGNPLFGPFEDVDGFHECLRGGLPLETAHDTLGEAVAKCHNRQYATRFTHGDLSMLNILVRDGRIAAILDWECTGWYPEYWEYTRAHYRMFNMPDFYQLLREQMETYDEELAAERRLWDRLDQPLDQLPG